MRVTNPESLLTKGKITCLTRQLRLTKAWIKKTLSTIGFLSNYAAVEGGINPLVSDNNNDGSTASLFDSDYDPDADLIDLLDYTSLQNTDNGD
jgi:hypothetical protein